ncbi:GNAT family N-acetyltransferase [bacterium]|nr:GNAT family N-acetyltransferase [bacterium]
MKNKRLNLDEYSLRNIKKEDVDAYLNYFYSSPKGYIESLGVDPDKRLPEETMKANFLERCKDAQKDQSTCPVLAIVKDDQAEGILLLNCLNEKDAHFHAHIFDPDLRRKGIVTKLGPEACTLFFERFKLEKIIFRFPAKHTGNITILEKMGLKLIREESSKDYNSERWHCSESI